MTTVKHRLTPVLAPWHIRSHKYGRMVHVARTGIETANKEDKHGVGIGKRNKKRFAAQQVLGQLGRLAHNLIVWARRWLATEAPHIEQLGVKRLVRDVFHVNGVVERDPAGRIYRIVLNRAHGYAHRLCAALQALVSPQHVAVSLCET